MAKWSLYGVFVGGKWGMTTNKRTALQAAKEGRGYVRSLPYAGACSSYDAPTFKVLSDLVADYREEKA